jgi:hypothetical protein
MTVKSSVLYVISRNRCFILLKDTPGLKHLLQLNGVAVDPIRDEATPTRSATPGGWAARPRAASYPPAPGRVVVTAVGAGDGLTRWGKTECMKWG